MSGGEGGGGDRRTAREVDQERHRARQSIHTRVETADSLSHGD